jgi:hypothetical protein
MIFATSKKGYEHTGNFARVSPFDPLGEFLVGRIAVWNHNVPLFGTK